MPEPRATPSPDVTDTELSVLRALWREQPATIRRLTDLLYPDGGTAHYATVSKLLERLEAKGFVERTRDGRVNRYRASIGRRELIAKRLQAMADRWTDGALAPLLTHLVDSAELSAEDVERLRERVMRQDPGTPKS